MRCFSPIDRKHHRLHFFAFLEDLGWVADLLGPRQIADVQQSIDPFFDLDERAVVGDVPHLALDHRARRILLGNAFPRVLLDLLHAEADFLLVLVDLQHLHLDVLALRDHFARVIDALRPGHLGDVHQAFDAFFQLDERAVRHDVDDLGLVNAADRILALDVLPGRCLLLLQAQRDLFLFLVDRQNLHFDFLVDLEHFTWMIDPAPAHVGDVQEAIDAAQVDERAEVGDVLDRALDDLAEHQAVERLALQLFTLLLDHLSAGDDDVATFFVDLENDRIDRAADPVADFARPTNIDLRRGKEDRHADIDEQAALDFLGDFAGDGVAFLLALHDGFPVDDSISLAFADLHQTGVAFDVFQQDAHFVAGLDVFGFIELGSFENAFGFKSQLDDEIIASVAGDFAFDDRAGSEVLNFVPFDELVQIAGCVAKGVEHGSVDFVVQVSQRVDEVVIDHTRCWGFSLVSASAFQRRRSEVKPFLCFAWPNSVEDRRHPRSTGVPFSLRPAGTPGRKRTKHHNRWARGQQGAANSAFLPFLDRNVPSFFEK